MKNKNIILIIIVLFGVIYIAMNNSRNEHTEQTKNVVEKYPWQITLLANGNTRVFGIVFNETTLQEVDLLLKTDPEVKLFESDKNLSLEAYYKNVLLGGLIGSFIISLDVSESELQKFKSESKKRKRHENTIQHEFDKIMLEQVKKLTVKNLSYIPTAQLEEEMIVKRFGVPEEKIKLKNNEKGWHYLYPKKGLDLIYKEEGKEVLQYVTPREFSLLLEPLRSLQNQSH